MSNYLDFPPIGDLIISPHDYVYAPDGIRKRSLLTADGSGIDEEEHPVLASRSGITDGEFSSSSLTSSLSITVDSDPEGVVFKPDGLVVFVIGNSNDTIYRYDLTTAWDLSTATYSSISFYVGAKADRPSGLAFNSTGTILYVTINISVVRVYTLTTAWDITSATYSTYLNTDGDTASVLTDIILCDSDTRIFVCDGSTYTIYQYSVDSDGLGMTYTDEYTPTQQYAFSGLVFSSDGLTLYLVGGSSSSVYKHTLTTAWDLSTATESSDSLEIKLAYSLTLPKSIGINADDNKLYLLSLNGTTTSITEFDMPDNVYLLPDMSGQETPEGTEWKVVADLYETFGYNSYTETFLTGNTGLGGAGLCYYENELWFISGTGIYNIDSSYVVTLVTTVTATSTSPQGLCLDDDNFYVVYSTGSSDHMVTIPRNGGTQVLKLISTSNEPTGVVKVGNLFYVCNYTYTNVVEYDSSFDPTGNAWSTGDVKPLALAYLEDSDEFVMIGEDSIVNIFSRDFSEVREAGEVTPSNVGAYTWNLTSNGSTLITKTSDTLRFYVKGVI